MGCKKYYFAIQKVEENCKISLRFILWTISSLISCVSVCIEALNFNEHIFSCKFTETCLPHSLFCLFIHSVACACINEVSIMEESARKKKNYKILHLKIIRDEEKMN